jgi:hypothetical protein
MIKSQCSTVTSSINSNLEVGLDILKLEKNASQNRTRINPKYWFSLFPYLGSVLILEKFSSMAELGATFIRDQFA